MTRELALRPPADSIVEPLMIVGRYAVFDEIAQGGFASVHIGRTFGAGGFARTVAVKRLHAQYAKDPEVSAMFLDEARVVARIRHPNVLPTLDLLDEGQELFLVMEYVEGVTLRFLQKEALERKRRIPLGIALRIMCGALRGLHAAHEARDEQGELLHLIHRDVSPENILVGVDGHARLLDFGVARALGQFHSTRDGEVKGKMQYLTPEQVRGEIITRRTDIFSASVVLWEVMTGKSLFADRTIAGIAHALVNREIPRPSEIAGTPKKLDGIVMQGLERDPDARWATAEKMAQAIDALGDLVSEEAVSRYVHQAGSDKLRARSAIVARAEAAPMPSRAPMDSSDFSRLSAVAPLKKEAGDIATERADLSEAVAAEKALAAPASDSAPAPSSPPRVWLFAALAAVGAAWWLWPAGASELPAAPAVTPAAAAAPPVSAPGDEAAPANPEAIAAEDDPAKPAAAPALTEAAKPEPAAKVKALPPRPRPAPARPAPARPPPAKATLYGRE